MLVLLAPALGAVDDAAVAFCAGPERSVDGTPTPLPDELRCLAMNVYFEARGDTDDGQIAVARVVINRAANPKYPQTLCGVVHQGDDNKRGCQFSWVCDHLDHTVRLHRAWNLAVRNACRAVRAPVPDPTRGALIYHATTMLPDWANSDSWKRTAVIGRHVFYTAR